MHLALFSCSFACVELLYGRKLKQSRLFEDAASASLFINGRIGATYPAHYSLITLIDNQINSSSNHDEH